MTFEQLMTILAPIAPILIASSWLHGTLATIKASIEVALARLTSHDDRINRMEDRIERLERANQETHK
jgi:hypothetical protein